MTDTALLRIGILAAGLLLVAAIFLFGRPKKKPQSLISTALDWANLTQYQQFTGLGQATC